VTSADPRPRIRQFLHRHIQTATVKDDDDIFGAGFANSMFAMQLVLFVEKEFQVAMTDDDLDLDHFRSIQAIAALVERKRQSV
jgi:acyl carrier protein